MELKRVLRPLAGLVGIQKVNKVVHALRLGAGHALRAHERRSNPLRLTLAH